MNEDVLLYTSASAGEKSGAVAFDSNGQAGERRAGRTLNFEAGIKSYWWNRRATVNANLYYTKVRDYQNVTSEPDPTSPTGFSSRLGNIPGIRARGVELDSQFSVTEHLQVTCGGAFNDAIYTDWSTATCPRSYPSSVVVLQQHGEADRRRAALDRDSRGRTISVPLASGVFGASSSGTTPIGRSTTSSSCCRLLVNRRAIRLRISGRA